MTYRIVGALAALCLAIAGQGECATLSPGQKDFVDGLALVVPGYTNLDRTTCHVSLKGLTGPAAAWQGSVTAFYNARVLPREWARMREFAKMAFAPGVRVASVPYPSGANPLMDEACVNTLFPPATTLQRDASHDPILAFTRAIYLFDQTGCARSAEIEADFTEAGDDHVEVLVGGNPPTAVTRWRAPYADYFASIVILKCEGDIDRAAEAFDHSAALDDSGVAPASIRIPRPGEATPSHTAEVLRRWGYNGT